MSGPSLDVPTFWSRLGLLFAAWDANPVAWGSADATCVSIVTGKSQTDGGHGDRALALQLHLFGFFVSETGFFFHKPTKTLHIFCTAKRRQFFSTAGASRGALSLTLHDKSTQKGDAAGDATTVARILAPLLAAGAPMLKVSSPQTPDGEWFARVSEAADAASPAAAVAVPSAALAALFQPQDDVALAHTARAGRLTAGLINTTATPTLSGDASAGTTPAKWAGKIDGIFGAEDETALPRACGIVNAANADDTGDADPTFTPFAFVASATGVNAGPDAVAPAAAAAATANLFGLATPGAKRMIAVPATGGAVVYGAGVSASSYAAAAIRTLIVAGGAAGDTAAAGYASVVKARDAAVALLGADKGASASAVAAAVADALDAEAKALAAKGLSLKPLPLTGAAASAASCWGTGIGLDACDTSVLVSAGSAAGDDLKAGCVVMLRVAAVVYGGEGAEASASVVAVGDTIIVGGDVVTAAASTTATTTTKRFPTEAAAAAPSTDSASASFDSVRRSARAATVAAGAGDDAWTAEQEAAWQLRLAEERAEQALAAIEAAGGDGAANASTAAAVHTAYTSVTGIKKELRPTRVTVDRAAQSVLLPVQGRLLPVHISAVKSVKETTEAGYSVMRLTFQVPDARGSPQSLPAGSTVTDVFVKEASYRTKSKTALKETALQIDRLRKEWLQARKDNAAAAAHTEQAPLKISTAPPARLRDVAIRPAIARGKRVTGLLTMHATGFRYNCQEGAGAGAGGRVHVDILYDNVKALFFSHATASDACVILHIELKSPIRYGAGTGAGKVSNYFQFVYEVADQSQDVAGGAGRYDDADEAQEEEEERRRRKTWNQTFRAFCDAADEAFRSGTGLGDGDWSHLSFDTPYSKLRFTGVQSKESTTLVPTRHALVALDDRPPLVALFRDLELVVLERAEYGHTREFDLVLVHKQSAIPAAAPGAPAAKGFQRILSVDKGQADTIKTWLREHGVLYYATQQALHWEEMLGEIRRDYRGFLEDGGWRTLFADDEEEDEDEDGDAGSGAEESDSDVYQEESSEESESDEYSSDGSGSESGSGSGSGSEAEEEEESDVDWDALEAKAKREDKERSAKRKQKGEQDSDSD